MRKTFGEQDYGLLMALAIPCFYRDVIGQDLPVSNLEELALQKLPTWASRDLVRLHRQMWDKGLEVLSRMETLGLMPFQESPLQAIGHFILDGSFFHPLIPSELASTGHEFEFLSSLEIGYARSKRLALKIDEMNSIRDKITNYSNSRLLSL